MECTVCTAPPPAPLHYDKLDGSYKWACGGVWPLSIHPVPRAVAIANNTKDINIYNNNNNYATGEPPGLGVVPSLNSVYEKAM